MSPKPQNTKHDDVAQWQQHTMDQIIHARLTSDSDQESDGDAMPLRVPVCFSATITNQRDSLLVSNVFWRGTNSQRPFSFITRLTGEHA